MKAIGPFTLTINTPLDIRVSDQPGLCVGIELQNVSGMLLRVTIGGKPYWLPAFRINCFPMDDETEVNILPILVENPSGTMLLVRAAYRNDAASFEEAFPGNYPSDIVRAVGAAVPVTFFKRGQAVGDGVNPAGSGAINFGNFHTGTTFTLVKAHFYLVNEFGGAGSAFHTEVQYGLSNAGVGIWNVPLGVGPNIGDHDHFDLNPWDFIHNGDDGFGGSVFTFQFNPGIPKECAGYMLVQYRTSFGTPV